jgi:hypothetical protein
MKQKLVFEKTNKIDKSLAWQTNKKKEGEDPNQ